MNPVESASAAKAAISISQPLLGQSAVCEPILRALPEWFGIEESLVQYVRDIEGLPTFVARIEDQPIGFLCLRRHFDASAEMHVLGVSKPWHRRGVGKAMVLAAERWLLAKRVEYLHVKTLGPSRPCAQYAATRQFYEAMGFRALEEFKGRTQPVPGHGEADRRMTDATELMV